MKAMLKTSQKKVKKSSTHQVAGQKDLQANQKVEKVASSILLEKMSI